MCGRYALALWPSQIRRMLRDDSMPVYEAPDDPGDNDDGSQGGGGGEEGEGGEGGAGYNGPRQSYNFAPSYRGIVYRADVPDWGAGPRSRRDGQTSRDTEDLMPSPPDAPNTGEHIKNADEQQTSTQIESKDVHYKLQAMKWGLIPFWTKRNPGYGSVMKTINCRDDSLAHGGGMWSSMKARKRCIVIAQGFYEWLKKDGGREKMPHYIKRKDGKLMCLAGLWDVVQYENDEEKLYTYTIVTTDSNKQLSFLHDRMPVIFDNGSEKLHRWLDPKRYEWSKELQSLLRPYDGDLEVYPVSKDVGKVGNNSPAFIIPVDSKENKSNIANFFAKGAVKKEETKKQEQQPEIKFNKEQGFVAEDTKEEKINVKHKDTKEEEAKVKLEDVEEDTEKKLFAGIKREAEKDLTDHDPRKKPALTRTTASPQKGGRQKKTISVMSNSSSKSPNKSKAAGTQKITKFFANSS